jgi:hypothetical protein
MRCRWAKPISLRCYATQLRQRSRNGQEQLDDLLEAEVLRSTFHRCYPWAETLDSEHVVPCRFEANSSTIAWRLHQKLKSFTLFNPLKV